MQCNKWKGYFSRWKRKLVPFTRACTQGGTKHWNACLRLLIPLWILPSITNGSKRVSSSRALFTNSKLYYFTILSDHCSENLTIRCSIRTIGYHALCRVLTKKLYEWYFHQPSGTQSSVDILRWTPPNSTEEFQLTRKLHPSIKSIHQNRKLLASFIFIICKLDRQQIFLKLKKYCNYNSHDTSYLYFL